MTYRDANHLKKMKCNFPMIPSVRLSVCWLLGWLIGPLVGMSVCHNFLTGREVTLPCSYRSTCFLQHQPIAAVCEHRITPSKYQCPYSWTSFDKHCYKFFEGLTYNFHTPSRIRTSIETDIWIHLNS